MPAPAPESEPAIVMAFAGTGNEKPTNCSLFTSRPSCTKKRQRQKPTARGMPVLQAVAFLRRYEPDQVQRVGSHFRPHSQRAAHPWQRFQNGITGKGYSG